LTRNGFKAFNTSANNVMQCAGGIHARFAGHENLFATIETPKKVIF